MLDRIAKRKLHLFTTFFTVLGIVSWLIKVEDPKASIPLAIFYFILLINTYYSIQLFLQIIPSGNKAQDTVDILLVLTYLCLAWSFNSPLFFTLFATVLFVIATIKYSLLVGKIPYPKLLKRKIRIDMAGIATCGIALLLVWAGFATMSIWTLAIVFAVTNFVLFFITPLYTLEDV